MICSNILIPARPDIMCLILMLLVGLSDFIQSNYNIMIQELISFERHTTLQLASIHKMASLGSEYALGLYQFGHSRLIRLL